jgi:hypothetical protein
MTEPFGLLLNAGERCDEPAGSAGKGACESRPRINHQWET